MFAGGLSAGTNTDVLIFALCYELLVNVLSAAQVRLYMDCEEYHRVAFSRSPQPLTFEASSGIFVGNAGGTGLARFVVSRDASWIYCGVFLNVCAQTALWLCTFFIFRIFPNVSGSGSA